MEGNSVEREYALEEPPSLIQSDVVDGETTTMSTIEALFHNEDHQELQNNDNYSLSEITSESDNDELPEDVWIRANSAFLDNPLIVNEQEIIFVKGMCFLLKVGCTEDMYQNEFMASPFYNSQLYPMTLKTAKKKLFELSSCTVQVITLRTLTNFIQY
jgi:hypothetical protein